MERVLSYRDLKIWQMAVELAPGIYRLLKTFPKEENYALSDQIRRAVVSIPANIAEGQARQHTREFLQHLSVAKGSLAELDTLLIIAVKLGYLEKHQLSPIADQIRQVRIPMQTLINRLQAKLSPSGNNQKPRITDH